MKNIEKRLDREIANLLKIYNVQEATTSASNALREPGHNFTYADFLSDKMLIIKAIGLGVPYSLFEIIKEYTPFNENDWSSILDVSTKTLQRYKQANAHFKTLQSQKIIEMSEVTKLGIDVFGNIDSFKLWLETPNFALGNVKPKDLLKDSYGKELVMGELTSIEFGIFA
jgi:putative toxin-antitoxin system antitoxin component (TIGR02293 family)